MSWLTQTKSPAERSLAYLQQLKAAGHSEEFTRTEALASIYNLLSDLGHHDVALAFEAVMEPNTNQD